MIFQKIYFHKNNLRVLISNFTTKYLAFPRKTAPYIISFLACKLIDLFLKNQTIVKCINGVSFELDTNDLIDFRLFYFGSNEKHIVNYLESEIGQKKTVLWDIGINLGSITLPLLQTCPNLKVYGFEASPTVFNRLIKNVDLNSNSRLNIYQKAIGENSGTVDFFLSPTAGNSGLGSLSSISKTRSNKVIVECISGDQLIEIHGLEPPSFIKIDVEGFEYEVLIGLKNFLSQHSNVKIIYEHEPYRLKSRERLDLKIIDFLENLEFEIYRLSSYRAFYSMTENSLEKLDPSMLNIKCDLVAIR